jgi:hypothetical protein
MKNAVVTAYAMTPADCPTGKIEIDHLISRELGGAGDVKNLWPQCYEQAVAGKMLQCPGRRFRALPNCQRIALTGRDRDPARSTALTQFVVAAQRVRLFAGQRNAAAPDGVTSAGGDSSVAEAMCGSLDAG